jgi:dGTPase
MDKKGNTKLKYSQEDKERYPRFDEEGTKGDERPPFEIDRSRIIYCSAFRRLQGKTQVFSPGEGDFVRTRLTHSLEVAQIGKGLALRFGADPTLVEAICLAHDLGHPPFGHAGGKALEELMKDNGGFEANAQNIQLLCFREKRRDDYEGLNLTRATLDGILKYKYAYQHGKDQKRFYYSDSTSIPAVEWAAKYSYPSSDIQSFECQLMDWADEVAYSIHDFEDALHSGFISLSAFDDQYVFSELFPSVVKKLKDLHYTCTQDQIETQWNNLKNIVQGHLFPPNPDPRVHRANRKRLTSDLLKEFIQGVERTEIEGAKTDRYRYRLLVPTEIRTRQLLLNKLIDVKVMQSARVQILEEKGKRLIRGLFQALVENPASIFPDDWRPEVKKCKKGSDYDTALLYRLTSDYISGMTDTFAEKLYSRLYVPGFGSVHDFY